MSHMCGDHLDRSSTNATRRITRVAPLVCLGVASALALGGCVRYSSNRDHLEREAFVLSPSGDGSQGGSATPRVGVRN